MICVETNEYLKRFTDNLDKLARVKAFVVWGEKQLPAQFQGDKRFFLWKDFLKHGQDVPEESIHEKMAKQKPGECCCLIYTSGTTGNPKGCMLSHDNFVWQTLACLDVVARTQPEALGVHNRILSYLPLSHIAGYCFDILQTLFNACELYFAKPDAL